MIPPRFERAVAYGLYRGTMRALLHLLKFEGMEPVARRLGELMVRQIAILPALPGALTVVPVPLFGAKQRARGFNQAELLARAVVKAGRRQGLDWRLESTLLHRRRATRSQAGLNPRQRRENVRGVFFVPGSHRDDASVAGEEPKLTRQRVRDRLRHINILLVDDIYTTGATARAASMALRDAGAASVWVATAARAQRLDTVPLPPLPMHEDVAFWAPAASLQSSGPQKQGFRG